LLRVLGIESSCDETAAAVVAEDKRILSNIISSQIENHERFGGVVPEIAARAHMENIDYIVAQAVEQAGVGLDDLDAVAATCGPGLIGGVIVGMMAGKTIASVLNKPFIGVNHLEGHALSPLLSDNVSFPYVLLLVSGAHTQLVIAEDVGVYHLLGTTLDDAVGECFDKAGRMLGLPFPGGKYVAGQAALCADRGQARDKFPLPRPLKGRKDCNFSFSGLKTAVMKHCENPLSDGDVIDLCASLEDAIADVMEDRCARAIDLFQARYGVDRPHLVSGGGVAANTTIRDRLIALTRERNMIFTAPPAALCTDNGAMIAWVGIERLKRNLISDLAMKARPRWPLEEL